MKCFILMLSVMTAAVDLEPEAVPMFPRSRIFVHVVFKGLQVGAVTGLATYALRLPSIVKNYKLSIKQASPVSSHESAIGTLQRCMFHGCMHAFLTGSCVATYHLAFMSKEAAEDISYRIVHAPYQNMIDSCSMLGASMGVLYGLLIRTFDHHKDPFVRKSMLQNMISNTSSVYQRIFSFSWMNPKIRHITSFGCIGVGGGVAFHFAATRNMVSPKQLWVYTVKCVS